jgi:hypothetical protein
MKQLRQEPWEHFLVLKVPRQCPLVLLVEVRRTDSEVCIQIGQKLSRVCTAFGWNVSSQRWEDWIWAKFSFAFQQRYCALCAVGNQSVNIIQLSLVLQRPHKSLKHDALLIKFLQPRKRSTSITKINWLMTCRNIIAAYSVNHTKPINIRIVTCMSDYRRGLDR